MDFKYLRNFKWHRYERANKVGNQKFDYGYEGILYRCLPKILFKGNPSITAFLQLIDMRLIMMFKTIDDIKHFKDIHWDPTISDVNKPIEVNPILKERKYYIEFVLDDGIDYIIYKGEKYYRDTKVKVRKGNTIKWEVVYKDGFYNKHRFGSHLVQEDKTIYIKSKEKTKA